MARKIHSTTRNWEKAFGNSSETDFGSSKIQAKIFVRKFGPGIMILALQLFPSLLARESLAVRELMTKAFLRYFKNDGHLEGSGLIKTRVSHSQEYGISLEDIAKFECGGTLAILANTSPTAFWMTYHIYSDENLLQICREELSKIVSDSSVKGKDGKVEHVRTLDMTKVKTSCPALMSTFQEVLRTKSVAVSVRLVTEDHMLDGKYLLKKGSTLMMPAPVQHTNLTAFASMVDAFDHRRFLPGERSHHPMGFRGFGGGTTLCPGRHFATTEIVAFTALLLLKCDIKPVDGKWVCPTTIQAGLWESTPRPDNDVEVIISPRTDIEPDTKFKVLLTNSDKAVSFLADPMNDV